MKVKEVLAYLQTLNPDYKVTMKVESRTGELEQREIFMIEDAYWGRVNPRVIFYPGRRAPDSERKRRVRCKTKSKSC